MLIIFLPLKKCVRHLLFCPERLQACRPLPSHFHNRGRSDDDGLRRNEGGHSIGLSGQQLHRATPTELNQFTSLYLRALSNKSPSLRAKFKECLHGDRRVAIRKNPPFSPRLFACFAKVQVDFSNYLGMSHRNDDAAEMIKTRLSKPSSQMSPSRQPCSRRAKMICRPVVLMIIIQTQQLVGTEAPSSCIAWD